MKGKWLLLTFGAGLPNWRAAAQRLGRQGNESGWFQEILVYDEKRLQVEFPDFVRAHADVLKPSVRGFGWWIWKPFLISKALAHGARTGLDGMVYLDAGFEINSSSPRGRERLGEYFQLAEDQGGAFAMHLPGHPERAWSRSIVMDRFRLSSSAREAPQIQATPLLSISEQSRELAESWLAACTADDYALIRDAREGEMNDLGFREHRHDQSVFSCLLKSRTIPTIPDETFWAPDWVVRGADYPLWAARNRTRVSVVDTRRTARAVRFAEKAYSRAHRELAERIKTGKSRS